MARKAQNKPQLKKPRKKYNPKKNLKKPTSTQPFFLLDRFSANDLTKWKTLNTKYSEYFWTQHHSLAFQREKYRNELFEAINDARKENLPFKDWTRIVPWKYSNDPLSNLGSIKSPMGGGRFNYSEFINLEVFEPFGALYLASDRKTATMEAFACNGNQKGLSGHDFFLKSANSVLILSVT